MQIKQFKAILLILIFSINLYANNTNNTIDEILSQTKNKSALSNYASKKDLKLLEQKLKEHKNIGIRIYGDSHTAADFFPRVIRGYLIKSNSIGFAYPLQPKYQQNLNLDYSYKDYEILNSRNTDTAGIDFPLGGIIAKAKIKGAKINLDTTLDKKKFKIGFLFKAKQNTNAFSIKDAKNQSYELRTTQINKWSYKELELDLPLQISALQKDAELGGYFITNKDNNVFLDTIAINGAKSDLWLSWNQTVVKKELGLLHNDLIILAYGSNDALFKGFEKQKFKNNLKKWISILKTYNKNALIMLVSPPTVVKKQGKKYTLAPDFFAIRQALYEVAKEEKTLLFDMHQFMQDSGGKNKWIEQKLSLQDVHLTIKGYELMAKKLLDDLKKYVHY
ncbi:TPA: SGNH/GDSL hydrolase family protein [Campylobacter coli]|nr:SGNH/GDSL hydrolase family protein [Campylobacter coli]HEQ3632555.1 SGNH/GDSL hydrolase family protein [Campylobacter coli]